MLEIILSREDGIIRSEARNVPIPEPEEDEVLIQVIATGSNPKDWKAAAAMTINQGDDIAGCVSKVGSKVYEFKPGDRVAAFHRLFQPAGSYAQYSIAPCNTTFHLPSHTSFEAAATLPLASMTAAMALYQHLRVPTPWAPVKQGGTFPILIYGGASAVGAYALKFAKLSNLNPIITVAGDGINFIESLGVADYIVDYRRGNVSADLKDTLDRHQINLSHAFDCVSKDGSWKHILDVLGTDGSINMVDPPDPAVKTWPRGISYSRVFVSTAYGVPFQGNRSAEEAAQDRDFAQIFYRYISFLLNENRIGVHPYEIQPNGLFGVQKGVQALHDGKISATKLIYRIKDTANIDQYR